MGFPGMDLGPSLGLRPLWSARGRFCTSGVSRPLAEPHRGKAGDMLGLSDAGCRGKWAKENAKRKLREN